MKFRNFLIYFILSSFLFSQEIQTRYIQNNEVLPQNLKKMSFSFSDIKFGKTGDFDLVIIDGCDTGEIGGYSIPYKVFSFEIEGEFSVNYVEVKNIEKVEIEKKINLARKEIDESVGGFIPGKFVDSGSSNYRGKTLIVVKIYPFQYNPETKKALFLKKGEIEIYYGEISKNEEKEIKINYTTKGFNATPYAQVDIVIKGEDSAFNQYWPSEINPQSNTTPIFLYDLTGGEGQRSFSGCAGIKYYDQSTGGSFVYLSSGFEAINNLDGDSNGRKYVLKKILDWLGAHTETGLFKAIPGDGQSFLSWVFPDATNTNILILYKAQTGYPTGIPQNGDVYQQGETIGDGNVLYVGTGTSYTHTGLTNGISYYYTAYVYDSQTKTYKLLGNASAIPQTGSQPQGYGQLPPINLIASARWTGSMWVVDLSRQDNSTDEDGSEIERKEGQVWNKIEQVGANVRNYTDDNNGTGLTENTTYTYIVRAFRGTDYSGYLNEASTITTSMLPPTDLQAIGGVKEVHLIWQSTTSNQIGFEIERKHPTPTNPNDNYRLVTRVNKPDQRTFTDTSIAPDSRPYYYRIRAYNQTDKTNYSNEAWGIPTAFPYNENPTNLQAFAGLNSIIVSWNDNTQNENYYRIEFWYKRVPDDTSLPDITFDVKGVQSSPYTGPCEATITSSTIFSRGGRWYIRLNALHKTSGYGYSWYAEPSREFSNKPSIPEGLRYDQKTKWHYIWVDLPEIPSSGGGGGGCFIASLCFGENSWQVKIFKEFRDKILMRNTCGRKFVSFYYKNSPYLVDYLKKHTLLILPVKFLLYFLLIFVFLLIYKVLFFVVFITGFVLIIRRHGRKW